MSRLSKEELERIRIEAIDRDLTDLPGFGTYLVESFFTPPWDCECATHACTEATCGSCGAVRPKNIRDKEQEGKSGSMRRLAGTRGKSKVSFERVLREEIEHEFIDDMPPLYE